MTAPLDSPEQHLVRSMFGYWRTIRAVGYSYDGERSCAVDAMGGSTHVPLGDGRVGGAATRPFGIGWSTGFASTHGAPGDYDLVVTWPRIRDHLAELRTPGLVAECRANAAEGLAIAQIDLNYQHRTADPVAFDAAVQARSERWRAHRQVESDLLDRIYPATAADAEPTDLLGLLAAG